MADDYSAGYDPDSDFDVHFTRATGEVIAAKLGGGERVLELGCATGAMTEILAAKARDVVAVDRSREYLQRAGRRRLHGVIFVQAELETDLPVDGQFDHVVLANVLHELDDPASLLRRVADTHLAEAGTVHISLQNPQSIHRLHALSMGLIDDLKSVSAYGQRYATRRLYDAADVQQLAGSVGLSLVGRKGIMLKPLPNDAMAKLSAEQLAGFVTAAKYLPDHCAMNLFAFKYAG